MNFLKKFFNDESNVVGLCSFKMAEPTKHTANPLGKEIFFNPFEKKIVFETNYSNNVLLL